MAVGTAVEAAISIPKNAVKTGAKIPNTTSSPIASATSTPNATAMMLLVMKLFYQAPP
jgi:hypothetical protein